MLIHGQLRFRALEQINKNFKLMPRLHMQVWKPGAERKFCINVFSCCQVRAIFSLWRGWKVCLKLQAWNLSFKTWKSVFTNVRFRSWLSKPLCVNAALFNELTYSIHIFDYKLRTMKMKILKKLIATSPNSKFTDSFLQKM